MWKGLKYHEPIEVGPFKVELYDAGHILGSAIIHVEVRRKDDRVLRRPWQRAVAAHQADGKIPAADYCLIESTYGDRIHEDISRRREMLQGAIDETLRAAACS